MHFHFHCRPMFHCCYCCPFHRCRQPLLVDQFAGFQHFVCQEPDPHWNCSPEHKHNRRLGQWIGNWQNWKGRKSKWWPKGVPRGYCKKWFGRKFTFENEPLTDHFGGKITKIIRWINVVEDEGIGRLLLDTKMAKKGQPVGVVLHDQQYFHFWSIYLPSK